MTGFFMTGNLGETGNKKSSHLKNISVQTFIGDKIVCVFQDKERKFIKKMSP